MSKIKLRKGEAVEMVVAEAGRLVIRRADGTLLEAAGGLPSGYHVVDYFGGGVYLGADIDGIEPTFCALD